jgi:hypothetical protein
MRKNNKITKKAFFVKEARKNLKMTTMIYKNIARKAIYV